MVKKKAREETGKKKVLALRGKGMGGKRSYTSLRGGRSEKSRAPAKSKAEKFS